MKICLLPIFWMPLQDWPFPDLSDIPSSLSESYQVSDKLLLDWKKLPAVIGFFNEF
jgi:hypothetical protein